MKSFIFVLAVLAPFFASAITEEGNKSLPYTLTLSVADSNHYEGRVIDKKDLLVDIASDYDTVTAKQQLTITQSKPPTPRLIDRRKLVNTDSSKADKKPQVKILVYDKINGYLNWMQPWFVKAAKERCSTICTVTENKNQVRHLYVHLYAHLYVLVLFIFMFMFMFMFIFMFMLLSRETASLDIYCCLLPPVHIYAPSHCSSCVPILTHLISYFSFQAITSYQFLITIDFLQYS